MYKQFIVINAINIKQCFNMNINSRQLFIGEEISKVNDNKILKIRLQ